MTAVSIVALHHYPVKGCRGAAFARVAAGVTGLAVNGIADREWLFVDNDGRFVTQREHPRLCRVGAALGPDRLTLTVPDRAPVDVPLALPPGVAREVVIWRDTVSAFDQGDAAATLVSDWLGVPVRLVRFDPSRPRLCNRAFAGDSGAHTRFADGYPILVIGRASLDALNDRLAANGHGPLPMDRFRPSIVVEGLPAHDEEYLDSFTCGDVVLKMVKPCVRCQVTTTDQDTGGVGIEPLPTLDGYRHNEALGGPTFGMNAIVVAGAGGTLAVGAPVEVAYRF